MSYGHQGKAMAPGPCQEVKHRLRCNITATIKYASKYNQIQRQWAWFQSKIVDQWKTMTILGKRSKQ